MAIPDFQTIMWPMLVLAEARGARHNRFYIADLADHFALTEADRAELLPSGVQGRFQNRVLWAASYLARGGLLERPARGTYQITEAGRTVLQSNAQIIDMTWLLPLIEQRELAKHASTTTTSELPPVPDPEPLRTPEELIEFSHLALRDSLAAELLTLIKERPPVFFEHLVVELLVAMGYGGSLVDAGRAIGKTGDGGIDGIIKEDRLGLGFIYIQAKRWEGSVPRPAVQAFAGSLQGHHASKGVFITTSTFSDGARTFAERLNTRIVLIDGHELAQLMIDYNVGVATVTTYAIKRVDTEYFE